MNETEKKVPNCKARGEPVTIKTTCDNMKEEGSGKGKKNEGWGRGKRRVRRR